MSGGAALAARTPARAFFDRDPLVVAPELLGLLLVAADGRAGRIIEVEAYRGAEDPASHAFRGRTARNGTMFGPPGHLYVYTSYGIHICANVVCGPPGVAAAVLLRALEPVAGVEAMRQARWRTQRTRRDLDLCRGPGRLCQALGIGRDDDGTDLLGGPGPSGRERDDGPSGRERDDGPSGGERDDGPSGRERDDGAALRLIDDGVGVAAVAASTRIGLSVAVDRPWRWFVPYHPGVSRSAGG